MSALFLLAVVVLINVLIDASGGDLDVAVARLSTIDGLIVFAAVAVAVIDVVEYLVRLGREREDDTPTP